MIGRYNPKAAKNVPVGHTLLRPGEILPRGKWTFRLQWFGDSAWAQSDGSLGGLVYDPLHTHIFFAAIPTKSKTPEAVWAPFLCSIPAKATKADLVRRLLDTVDQLNGTGTKLVEAQNTITKLKKKVSK